jgi:hypothetical protein
MNENREALTKIQVRILEDLADATEAGEIHWDINMDNHALYKGEYVVVSLIPMGLEYKIHMSIYQKDSSPLGMQFYADRFSEALLACTRIFDCFEEHKARGYVEFIKGAEASKGEGPWR